MMRKTKASIVISTHNRREMLTDLLEDLAGQRTATADYEVLVIDSEAGVDVSDIVNEFAASGLTISHHLADNVLAAKRNAGARRAAGTHLIFLDDDLRVGPDFVNGHLRYHTVAPDLVVSGETHFPIAWNERSNYHRFKNSRHLNRMSGARDSQAIKPNRIVCMNLSLSVESFDRVGDFDEGFVRYGGEDQEFGYRCRRSGLKLIYGQAGFAIHVEAISRFSEFCEKLVAATTHGAPLVIQKVPEIGDTARARWTEPEVQKSLLDKLLYHGSGLLARPGLISQLIKGLDRSDRYRWMFAPPLYKAAMLLVVRRAVLDRV